MFREKNWQQIVIVDKRPDKSARSERCNCFRRLTATYTNAREGCKTAKLPGHSRTGSSFRRSQQNLSSIPRGLPEGQGHRTGNKEGSGCNDYPLTMPENVPNFEQVE